jgi:cytochrome c-type biogenesis protein
MIHESLLAFAAGVLIFISPCILPMIPFYLSFLGGNVSGENGEKKSGYILKVLLFIAGFSLVFVTIGVLTGLLTMAFSSIRFWLNLVFGILVIILGLHMTGIITILFLDTTKRLTIPVEKVNYPVALLLGMGFAAGWTPCVGPVLGSIIGLAASDATMFKGALLLSLFSIGLGLPLFITALLVERIKPLLDWLAKHAKIIKMISGLFIIGIGILIITGAVSSMTRLAVTMAQQMESYPVISNIAAGTVILVPGSLLALGAMLSFRKNGQVKTGTVVSGSLALALVVISILTAAGIIPVAGWIASWLTWSGL